MHPPNPFQKKSKVFSLFLDHVLALLKTETVLPNLIDCPNLACIIVSPSKDCKSFISAFSSKVYPKGSGLLSVAFPEYPGLFEELFRYLYDNASVYAEGSEGMVAIYINEYSYQANFRIDKEICAMALIAKLIELKK